MAHAWENPNKKPPTVRGPGVVALVVELGGDLERGRDDLAFVHVAAFGRILG